MDRQISFVGSCLVATAFVILAVIVPWRTVPPPPPAVPEPVVANPVPTIAEARPPAQECWMEEVGTGRTGWLNEGQYRYSGPCLDSWAVIEVAGASEEFSFFSDRMASDFWDVARHKSGVTARPTEGRMSAAVALPIHPGMQYCVVDVRGIRPGIETGWFKAFPFSGRWCRHQVTKRLSSGRTAFDPGQTRLVYQHLSEKQVNVYVDGWFARMHFKHDSAAAVRSGRSHDFSLDDRIRDREELRTPAAWTAGWLLASAGTGGIPFGIVTPYHLYTDEYTGFVRVTIYARFLSEKEIEQLRTKAAELQSQSEPDGTNALERLIKSFRKLPEW